MYTGILNFSFPLKTTASTDKRKTKRKKKKMKMCRKSSNQEGRLSPFLKPVKGHRTHKFIDKVSFYWAVVCVSVFVHVWVCVCVLHNSRNSRAPQGLKLGQFGFFPAAAPGRKEKVGNLPGWDTKDEDWRCGGEL